MKKPRYAVMTRIGNDWENVWTDTDPVTEEQTPTTFPTFSAASEALVFHFDHLEANGMDYDRADFKIKEIEHVR